MGHAHTKRLYDHVPGLRYFDPEKGREIAPGPNARWMTNIILDKLKGDIDHPNGFESGVTLSRRELFQIMGLTTKATYASLIRQVVWSGMLEAECKDYSSAYTFKIGPALDCLANGCPNPHHYPQGFKIPAPGVQNSNEGGVEYQTQGGNNSRPLKRTKDIKTSKTLESPVLVSGLEISAFESIDPETAIARSRSRQAIEEALNERGNPPITANLKEWAVILRANGNTGALERALEHTAQGYDLPDTGPWQQGRANIVELLVKTGRPN